MAEPKTITFDLTDKEIASILKRVSETNENGCNLWRGSLTRDGYGKIEIRNRPMRAHRLMYHIYIGPIPDDLFVLHKCDIRNCVSLNHLYLGTAEDNTRDAVERGRMAKGERNGARLHIERMPRGDNHYSRKHPDKAPQGERNNQAKLNDEKVRQIRNLRNQGLSAEKISKMFGVHRGTIQRIISRIKWKHVI